LKKVSKPTKNKIRKEKKNGNVLNIGILMRKYAPGMNVSPSAVESMMKRIEMFLEDAMPEIAKIAKANGCQPSKKLRILNTLRKARRTSHGILELLKNDVEPKIRKKEIEKNE